MTSLFFRNQLLKRTLFVLVVFSVFLLSCSQNDTDDITIHWLTSTPLYTQTPYLLPDATATSVTIIAPVLVTETPSITLDAQSSLIPELDFTWDFSNVKCNSEGDVLEASIVLIITGGVEPYEITPKAPFTITRNSPIDVTVESHTSTGDPSQTKKISLPVSLCKTSGTDIPPFPVYGCTDPEAINYNPSATIDDGSCQYHVYGCTDPEAINYNPSATIDDGSCQYHVYGCTDAEAINYNPLATIDDGSCQYIPTPCPTKPGKPGRCQ